MQINETRETCFPVHSNLFFLLVLSTCLSLVMCVSFWPCVLWSSPSYSHEIWQLSILHFLWDKEWRYFCWNISFLEVVFLALQGYFSFKRDILICMLGRMCWGKHLYITNICIEPIAVKRKHLYRVNICIEQTPEYNQHLFRVNICIEQIPEYNQHLYRANICIGQTSV